LKAAGARGFTLLEVLVAIAILGLGMTAILSAQTGLFASSTYAERISMSTSMLRCRLSEIELKLNKEGYPLLDMKDEGTCCGDESVRGYKCKWKIEKVELPLPPTAGDLSNKLSGGMSPSGFGALGAIASVGQSNGAVLGQGTGLGDISKLLAGQSPGFGGGFPGGTPAPADSNAPAFEVKGSVPLGSSAPLPDALGPTAPFGGGASSLAPMVMSMVYPTLKPMLEASIRKITVTVEWQGGGKGKSIDVVEYVTNPMQGGLDPNAAAGLEAAFSSLAGMLGGAAPGAAPGVAAPALGGGK
jgi:general secretion pathway protein I